MNTISLELAKELAAVAEENGHTLSNTEKTWIFRESMYADRHYECNQNEWHLIDRIKTPTDTCGEQLPAPNTNELLEVLPDELKDGGEFRLVKMTTGQFYCSYFYQDGDFIDTRIYEDAPQDALAKLLIYLIKNSLI